MYDKKDRGYQIIDPIEIDDRGRPTFFCSKFRLRMYICKVTGEPYFYNEKGEVCNTLVEKEDLSELSFLNVGDDFDPDDTGEYEIVIYKGTKWSRISEFLRRQLSRARLRFIELIDKRFLTAKQLK